MHQHLIPAHIPPHLSACVHTHYIKDDKKWVSLSLSKKEEDRMRNVYDEVIESQTGWFSVKKVWFEASKKMQRSTKKETSARNAIKRWLEAGRLEEQLQPEMGRGFFYKHKGEEK